MYFARLILLISFGLVNCDSNTVVYKFCVNELNSNGRTCQAIQKGNNLVVCIPVRDSVDCALKLQRKEADFGVFTAEESILASKFIDEDVRVVGHLRNTKWNKEPFAFQTVVVVSNNFVGGIPGLRNASYCHPGFGDGQLWSDRVLKEFEKAVVPRTCNEQYPNVHQETQSIANFFKSGCRPGQWAMDDLVDKKLKKKFPTLCSLCNIPSTCSYDEEFEGSHISALNCLTGRGGNVTYVALEHVKEYFGLLPGYSARAAPEEYKLLCPNGYFQTLSQPCTWVKQPWPVVVALKDKAPLLASSLPDFICKGTGCRGTWKEAFTALLEGSSNTFIQTTQSDRSLLDNIKEGRTIPREWEGDACRRTVRWCTISAEEQEKCEWLRQAVIAQDFEPRLSCIQADGMWSCFDLIKKQEADVMGIDSNYAFTAEKVFNFTAAMYQDNIYEGNYLIVAVIKAKNQNIKTLSDLKGTKACFPEYNGLAWNAFVSVTQNQKILPKECPRVKAVSNFFKDLCVPGATDSDHKDYNVSTPINNICSLCAKKMNNSKDICEASFNNKYYGDFGAFSCLKNNVSDVAFVDLRNIFSKDNKDFMQTIESNNYLILCANGTLQSFNASLIDENCAFATGIRGQIISRKKTSKAERRDVEDLLLKIDEKFGEAIFGYDNIMQMYGTFKGKKGLLFKETTVDLITVNDQNNNQVNNFVDLKAFALQECMEIKKSGSTLNQFRLSILSLACIIILMKIFV